MLVWIVWCDRGGMGAVPFTNAVGASIGRCVGVGWGEMRGGFVFVGEAWARSGEWAIVVSIGGAPVDLDGSMGS